MGKSLIRDVGGHDSRKHGATLFSALALGCLMALPSALRAEDLLSIFRLASENDPQVRAAFARYQAVQQAVPQARAGLLPQVNATLARNRNAEEVSTDAFIFSRPAGRASYYSDSYEVNLSQVLYDRALWTRLDQASAEVRRAALEYRAARQNLILRVAEAYFRVLLAQETVALAEAERQALARNLEAAEGRRRAGSGTIIEVHEARARFQVSAAQLIEATNELADSREALREISDRLPGNLQGLGDDTAFQAPEPAELSAWIETALQQNSEVLAAREALEVARLEIDRNRAGHFPTLEMVGTHSRHDADASIPGPGIRADDTLIGVQLTIPLYQGGAVSARTEEAAHRYGAAREELEARRRAVERSTRAAFQGVMASLARIDALELAINAAESALQAKTEGRGFGLYTTLDVLDATRELYQARRDLAEAQHTYLSNLLQLKYAAGVLAEDDVLAVNAWLRP
ncbi:MAG TPA: TolC family outer membrane protein [Hyphomicrobiaceae bacterium]|jgi:outer membrane protein